MSLQPPTVPSPARIAASSLTNQELAYLVDLFDYASDYVTTVKPPPGWTDTTENDICYGFREAAKIRGIANGVVVVTQTVDLRS